MPEHDRLAAFVVIIIAVTVATLFCVGLWHDRTVRRNFVEHGYQQTTIVGYDGTVWQKVAEAKP